MGMIIIAHLQKEWKPGESFRQGLHESVNAFV